MSESEKTAEAWLRQQWITERGNGGAVASLAALSSTAPVETAKPDTRHSPYCRLTLYHETCDCVGSTYKPEPAPSETVRAEEPKEQRMCDTAKKVEKLLQEFMDIEVFGPGGKKVVLDHFLKKILEATGHGTETA